MACCWLPAFTGFHRAGNVPLALERHRVASPSARAVPPCTSSSPNILALGAGVFALDVVLGHSKGTVRSAFLLGSHKYSAIVYSYMDDSAQTSNRQIASVVLLPAKSMNQHAAKVRAVVASAPVVLKFGSTTMCNKRGSEVVTH
jgi:hypothetical protein